MIKMNKLTDYAVILLSHMEGSSKDRLLTVSDLSEETGLGQATISKILKILGKTDIVISVRGINGGYYIGRPLNDISVADMIETMDGPLAMTACVESHGGECCSSETNCTIKGGWDALNGEMIELLRGFPISKIVEQAQSNYKIEQNLKTATG